jgi:hypothetical protein
MSDHHLASYTQHAAAFLLDTARRLKVLTQGSLHPMNPHFAKAARECEAMANELHKALQAEGYDRVY